MSKDAELRKYLAHTISENLGLRMALAIVNSDAAAYKQNVEDLSDAIASDCIKALKSGGALK